MVEFAGWEMPVQFSGLMEEHRAVRTAAGLFDVSHMGEIRVSGADAESLLEGKNGADYVIYVGLSLSRDERDYNRRTAR